MTHSQNRRNCPRQRIQFKKVQSRIHPRNAAFLKAEAKRNGQSLSEVVNDAVILYSRIFDCESQRSERKESAHGHRN